jgi:hypothetical protein
VPDHFAPQLFAHETLMLPDVGHWVPILAADTLARHIRALHGMAEERPGQ